MELRYGSVCSGIEAASVAWQPLGWEAAWLSEIEPFPSAVLAHHYPDIPNLGDMTRLPALVRFGEVEAPDVLVGGTPCQSFSLAGLRKGLADGRGQLTLSFVDLANAIDEVRIENGQEEAIITWENVPGVLSSKDNAFGCFLAALAGEQEPLEPARDKNGKLTKWADAGCVFGPQRTVAWRVLCAQYFGLAQRRRRVFVVASARKNFHPPQVLFEFQGLRRDTPPSRQPGEEITPTIRAGAANGGAGHGARSGDSKDELIVPVVGAITANAFNGGAGGRPEGAAAGHFIPVETLCVATGQAGAEVVTDMAPTLNCNHEAPYIAHTLRGEGFDASEDGTGRGTPLVVHGTQDPCTSDDLAFALGRNNGAENAVSYGIPGNWIGRKPENGGNAVEPMHEISPCLTKADRHGVAQPYTLAIRGRGDTHNLEYRQDGTANALLTPNGGRGGIGVGAIAFAQNQRNEERSMQGLQVRRLTPRECERLQGFPDDYTDIQPKGKPTADGPRYKSLGNSMATYVINWLGRRIEYGLTQPWQ